MRIARLTTILFTDKDDGQLMQCCKADTFVEILLGGGSIATVGDRYDGHFPQFTGESNASSVQKLCCHRSWTCYCVVFVVTPMQHWLLLLGRVPLIISCWRLFPMCLQICPKDLIRCHANSEHDPEVSIIG